GGRCAVARH
ncbi:hypothetical protein MKD33_20245, partial [Chromobacterium piscinae]